MQDWNFTVSWVEGQEVHQQVPDMLSRLVSNPEEIETSNDTDTAHTGSIFPRSPITLAPLGSRADPRERNGRREMQKPFMIVQLLGQESLMISQSHSYAYTVQVTHSVRH